MQFREITSQHGDANTKLQRYNIYRDRIDISALHTCVRCVYVTYAFYARTVLVASRLSPRNDISPEADRMESWHFLGDAFGKIRLYFKVSSRYLQLQQFDIVNHKNPPAIPLILFLQNIYLFIYFLTFRMFSFNARERIIKRLKRKKKYNFFLLVFFTVNVP